MDIPNPCTWLFIGDSITQAVVWTEGARGWVELATESLRYEADRPLDVVVNTAFSGWTTQDARNNVERVVDPWHADVVSISFGTNDCWADDPRQLTKEQFADNLRFLARRVPGARVVINTPALVRGDAPFHGLMPEYAQICREVAAEVGATLVDHESLWLERFADGDPSEVMADPIHPGPAGHVLMARAFLDAVGFTPAS